ncbi:MAG: tetratricopeptide repeat protein [Thiobacillaceae bacterium]
MDRRYQMEKPQWLLLVLIVSSTTSAIADWFAKTPEEESMCQARIFAGRDTSDRENWTHMHHYCDCLRFIDRAYVARDGYEREHALGVGVGGCDYVLIHTKPDFYMRAEVMTEKAVGQKMLGQRAQAAGTLVQAIEFDPNYVPAYMALSDYYRELGDRKKALDLVIDGLKHQPDSKNLMRRYKELGGKEPYPTPVATRQPSEQAPMAAQPAAKSATDVKATTTSPAAAGAATTADPGAVAPAPPKIGSPTNPYCRFCPD